MSVNNPVRQERDIIYVSGEGRDDSTVLLRQSFSGNSLVKAWPTDVEPQNGLGFIGAANGIVSEGPIFRWIAGLNMKLDRSVPVREGAHIRYLGTRAGILVKPPILERHEMYHLYSVDIQVGLTNRLHFGNDFEYVEWRLVAGTGFVDPTEFPRASLYQEMKHAYTPWCRYANGKQIDSHPPPHLHWDDTIAIALPITSTPATDPLCFWVGLEWDKNVGFYPQVDIEGYMSVYPLLQPPPPINDRRFY